MHHTRFRRPSFLTATIALTLLAAPALAEETPTTAAASQPTTQPGEKKTESIIQDAAVTEHEMAVGKLTLKYTATAAKMAMKDEAGKLKATMFFIAYARTGADDAKVDPGKRPLTFVFNGGPGAAAVWLHLGTAGPMRVALTEDGHVPPPPYHLVDNEYTWLDATDLVFIDPVGTGFSRPAEGEAHDQFYGVKKDIEWVGDFIRLYLTEYERWRSPIYLAGESYGTTRAAGLSAYLIDRYGIALSGIVFISTVLDFQTIGITEGNEIPYVLYLPSYTAAAWYHKKLPPELQQQPLRDVLDQAEAWTMKDYLLVLAQGRALSKDMVQQVARTLARFTGLPAKLIEESDLRIQPWTFEARLLQDEREIIGRFDTRITAYNPNPLNAWPAFDPSVPQYFAIYSSTFNDYVRRVLEFKSTLPYEVLTDRVRPWKFGEEGTGFLNVSDDLSSAMAKNPALRVLFASGYSDLATPYLATEYTISHLNLSPALRKNITYKHFAGGHMMYHNLPDLKKLKADIEQFMANKP